MNSAAIEIRVLDESLEKPLIEFFRDIRESGDEKYFHPHPFTDDEARKRAHYSGKDIYYVLVEGDRVLGYAMLRGWDEGYKVPSLGITIHPSVREVGLGRLFMHFLHVAARRRGCDKIRVKVYPQNVSATALYEKLGYKFETEEAGQLVGFVRL